MAAPVFEKKFVQDIRQPVRVRRCGDLMFTGDAKADTIYVEVYNDGVPYNLTGTVTLNCIRADCATVAVTGSISGNVAQATLAQACCAISGPLAVVMKITSGDVTSTILKAVYTVDVGVTGTTVDPGTIVNNVNTLIAAINAAVASVPSDYSDLLAAIAPYYSDLTFPVKAGQYCWYDGDLYRCTTAIPTTESWTAAHWTAAVVGNDIAELTSALAEKLDAPSTAGTAGQALVTDGNGGVSWADVEIEVDATLTQQGEAADAKATGDEITELKSAFDDIVVTTTSPNLYNPTVCNPADLHTYNSSGVYTESTYYATSGKIPVEAATQYTFSANGAVKNARYFKGDSGETFISGENTTGTFTTPALCTFVAVQLFAAEHTTEQYNAAIAVAQLELGDESTPYQPYGTESHILLESIDKGDELGNFVDVIESATSGDVGKALSPKTIENGVVTEWEFSSFDSSAVIDEITDTKQSKNLYNPAACNPADKYTYNSSGAYTASDVFATSGKIPVEAETQYIFSAGGARVKNVRYFKGDSGETFISGENVDDGPFTTPALCTFVAVQLFSAAHTTEQYEAAIAVAQLEKGATATPYEPYGETHYVPLSAVEDGDKLGGIGDAFITQSQINLYDKTFAVNGKYYYSDGSIQTSADWAITGYIPVEPNTQYNLSRDINAPMSLGGTVKMYDQDKTYIGNATLGNYVYDTLYAFVTGPTTHYIGVGLTLAGHTEQDFTDTIDTLMLCYGTMRPHNYAAYNSESVVPANKLGDAFFRRDNFAGKRWLATGTSITWYDGKAYQVGLHAGELCRGYVGVVTSRKKLLATNEGISGSTLGNVSDSSLINRYTSLDWAHADIATLEYGVNDLGHNIPVGTAADAAGTNTFAACLKTIIEYALAQNPKIILIICTDPDVRGANINSNGDTLKDFSDVTIAVAAQYRLPVCDWYYHSGINALNKGDQSKDWMTVDGTHPSDVGHQRMGAMLIQMLESVID